MGSKRKPIKQDIIQLVDLYNRGVSLNKSVKEAMLTHNRGLYKKFLLDSRVNHKRFKYKTQEIMDRLLSSVVSVKYLLDNEIYFSYLTNIEPEEIPILFEFLSSLYNKDIKLLEVNKIPTYIKSSKL